MGLWEELLEKFSCKLSLLPLPQPSSSSFFSVWTIEVMAGDPAAPLDQEETLKVEATGTYTRSGLGQHDPSDRCNPSGLPTWAALREQMSL